MDDKIADYDKLVEDYKQSMINEEKRQLEDNSTTISNFRDFCEIRGLNLAPSSFKFVQTIGIVAEHPNILGVLKHELQKDKEGLIKKNNLLKHFSKKQFNPGYFYSENFMAMASPLFRRGMHKTNNWSPKFIELLWLIDDPKIDTYIAIDFDRVRINVDDTCYLEEDTWYGAPFNKDISLIADGPTHLRPPNYLKREYLSFFFNSLYALDIFWSSKNNIKTFQSLEFKTEDIVLERNGIPYHPARYIHAEYDIEKERFRHFDGAIQFYLEDEYLSRRDSNFNHNIKDSFKIKANSEKLFKFNGDIAVRFWTEFISHFYTGNPLVHEYFTGQYPKHINELLNKINKRQST